MAQVKLTQAFADKLEYTKRGQVIYFDSGDGKLSGFGLCVGQTKKTWIAQGQVNGRTKRTKIGDATKLNVLQARKAAKQELAKMERGIDPVAEKRLARVKERGTTLEQAFNLWSRKRKSNGAKLNPRTIEDNKEMLKKYLTDWWDKPLVEISREMVNQRHHQLAADIAKGRYANKAKKGRGRRGTVINSGETTADHVFQVFRTMFRRAMRQDVKLLTCPTVNCDWMRPRTQRRPIPAADLPKWYAATAAMNSPLRRDLHRFVLFTGLRRESALNVRWEHVDLDARTLFVEKAKGGEERAFTLPLSDYLVALLRERRTHHEQLITKKAIKPHAHGFVFPGDSEAGHLSETREKGFAGPQAEFKLLVNGKEVKRRRHYSLHDLRRTFASVANEVYTTPATLGALLNHRHPKDAPKNVTETYISTAVEAMRAPMQQITDKLLALCQPTPEGGADVLQFKRKA